MQAQLEEEQAKAAEELAHERRRGRDRVERLEQRLEEKWREITALRKGAAS